MLSAFSKAVRNNIHRIARILGFNTSNGIISHQFVSGFEKLILYQIQMEGINYQLDVMTPKGYQRFLMDPKSHLETDTVDTFFSLKRE